MHNYLNFDLGLELQMPFPLFLGSSIVSFALTNPQAGLRAGLLTPFTGILMGFHQNQALGSPALFCPVQPRGCADPAEP